MGRPSAACMTSQLTAMISPVATFTPGIATPPARRPFHIRTALTSTLREPGSYIVGRGVGDETHHTHLRAGPSDVVRDLDR